MKEQRYREVKAELTKSAIIEKVKEQNRKRYRDDERAKKKSAIATVNELKRRALSRR